MTTAANCVNPSCWAAHYVWWLPSGHPKLAPARRCKCATKQSSSALPSSTIPLLTTAGADDGVTSDPLRLAAAQRDRATALLTTVGGGRGPIQPECGSCCSIIHTVCFPFRVFTGGILNLTEYFGIFRTSVPLPSVIEMACTFVYLYFQYLWPLCTFTFSIQEVPIPRCTVAYCVLRGLRSMSEVRFRSLPMY